MYENMQKIEEFLHIEHCGICFENRCIMMGQFSTGKSKFLNTLLGFDCLPVGTYETTDVPTYIGRGKDSVISYAKEKEYSHTFEEVNQLRKGKIELDSIHIHYHDLDIPENITLVDMPGVNSIDPRRDIQFEEALKTGNVVLYFLGKSISTVDIFYLNKIIGSGMKVIIVRTKIDRINIAEERIEDAVDMERGLYQKLFPDIDTYFVSLEGDCDQNEIDLLIEYIHNDLLNDIEKYKILKEKEYIRKTIRTQLISMRTQILKNRSTDNKINEEKLLKNVKKKSRKMKKILETHQSVIYEGFDHAKKNYMELGKRFIQNIEGDSIFKADVQQYILRLIDSLKRWYELEIEDGIRQIDFVGDPTSQNKYNVLDSIDVDRILNCAPKRNFLKDIFYSFEPDDENDMYFTSKREAEKYFDRVMDQFFGGIFIGFQNKYEKFVLETVQNYEDQNLKENTLILPMLTGYSEAALVDVENFLQEISNYVDR